MQSSPTGEQLRNRIRRRISPAAKFAGIQSAPDIRDTELHHSQKFNAIRSRLEPVLNLPSMDLLEQRHSFPCAFTFKVIGSSENNFTARVVAAIRDELGLELDPPFSLRHTAHGRHVAVTLEPECQSAQQVLAVYGRLTGMDGLVMLL